MAENPNEVKNASPIPFTNQQLHNAAGRAFHSLFRVGSDTHAAKSDLITLSDDCFIYARANNPTGSLVDGNNLSGCEFGLNVVLTGSPSGILVGAHRDLGLHGNKEHFQFIDGQRNFNLRGTLLDNLTIGSEQLVDQMYEELEHKWSDYCKQGLPFTKK